MGIDNEQTLVLQLCPLSLWSSRFRTNCARARLVGVSTLIRLLLANGRGILGIASGVDATEKHPTPCQAFQKPHVGGLRLSLDTIQTLQGVRVQKGIEASVVPVEPERRYNNHTKSFYPHEPQTRMVPIAPESGFLMRPARCSAQGILKGVCLDVYHPPNGYFSGDKCYTIIILYHSIRN